MGVLRILRLLRLCRILRLLKANKHLNLPVVLANKHAIQLILPGVALT